MAQQILNVGAAANDGTGDPLRTGMQKINANFTELYAPAIFGASAMPSSGTYSSGSFVRNTNIATGSDVVLFGWHRLTTGASHVSGTDWLPLYILTVSSLPSSASIYVDDGYVASGYAA